MTGRKQEDISLRGANLEMALNLDPKTGPDIRQIRAAFSLAFLHLTQAMALQLVWKALQSEEVMSWINRKIFEALRVGYMVSNHMVGVDH